MRLFIPALLFLEALGKYRYLGMSPAGKVGIPSLPLPVGTVNGLNTRVLAPVVRKVVRLWARSCLPLSRLGTGTYSTGSGQGYAWGCSELPRESLGMLSLCVLLELSAPNVLLCLGRNIRLREGELFS